MAWAVNYVKRGMRVIASDGNEVGTVEDVRVEEFVVRRFGEAAVSIPYGSIQNVRGQEVVLSIPSSEIERESGLPGSRPAARERTG